jgi:hypothetical protein
LHLFYRYRCELQPHQLEKNISDFEPPPVSLLEVKSLLDRTDA